MKLKFFLFNFMKYFRNIAELFFYMEELRHLVRRYDEVIQRYYVQYMYGYDSVVLNEAVQNLTVS